MSPPPLTLENILLQLRDFLVVWITQIVYYNHVYPENAFEQCKYLDLVVYQSRMLPLTDYLVAFANEMISVLVTKEGGGKVHDVIVVVYRESSLHILRRYLLNFSQFVGLDNLISSLDFLLKASEVHQARINLPGFDWNEIYASLRSLVFLHIQELRRTEALADKDLFYKLLLNTDNTVDLAGEEGQWVKLFSEDDTRKTKFVALGEVSTGFLRFDLHNEYIE